MSRSVERRLSVQNEGKNMSDIPRVIDRPDIRPLSAIGQVEELQRQLAAMTDLISKSGLVEVNATKIESRDGHPVIVPDGNMLVPKDQAFWMKEHTDTLQKMANMSRKLAAMTADRNSWDEQCQDARKLALELGERLEAMTGERDKLLIKLDQLREAK